MPSAHMYSGINRFAEPPSSRVPELGDTYTEETIDGVEPGGLYRVRGLSVGSRNGFVGQVGDRVTVLWRRGLPFVIVNAQTRKGTADESPGGFLPVVEQIAAHPDTGEVWFRNYNTFSRVVFVNDDGVEDPSVRPAALGISSPIPMWGRGHADYFLVFSPGDETLVAVYRLDRPKKNTPFSPAQNVKARLVQFYNLETDATEFGTLTITSTFPGGEPGGVATGPVLLRNVQYNNPGAGFGGEGPFAIRIETVLQQETFAVAPNGDLLATVLVVAQQGVGDSSEAGIDFQLGSLVINVTTSTVLVNRVVDSMSGTGFAFIVSEFACQASGSVECTYSLGVPLAESGRVLPLSYDSVDPQNPEASAAKVNNYLLLRPAWNATGGTLVQDPPGVTIGELACGPPRADIVASIVGEYEGLNADFATFPGTPSLLTNNTPVPLLGSQRGMVAWATLLQNTGVVAGSGRIRDLRRGVTSVLASANLPIYRSDGGAPPIVLTESMLVYKREDPVAPHNRQFFLAGHNRGTGEIVMDLDAPAKLAQLKKAAVLAKAKTPAQLLVANQANPTQVVVYRQSLTSFYVGGPL